MKFRKGQKVIHIATGQIYKIIHTPKVCRIEETGEPAYSYRVTPCQHSNSVIWVRSQAKMEDGRFMAT